MERITNFSNWIDQELRILKWLKLYSLTNKRQISVLGAQTDEKREMIFFKKKFRFKI